MILIINTEVSYMKVDIQFDIDNLEELEKVTKEIEKVVPKYTVKMEFDSDELHDESQS